MYHSEAERDLRRNIVVHVWDAGFYGLAIGLASLVTVLPLFVRELGATNLLVGLVAAMHPLGWHLPQLFTVQRTARARRILPVTQRFAFVERLPFLGLAILAWRAPGLDPGLVMALTFVLVFLFGVGGGLTAPPFQTMVGKIVPPANRGAFYGMKAGSANLMASLGAVAAGLLLTRLVWTWNFAACFLAGFGAMMISWLLLALTREHDAPPVGGVADGRAFWHSLGGILRRDANLRVLLVARSLSMFALMAQGFITVYVVGRFGASPATVGLMTGVFMVSQTVANPALGWLGDRWRHRSVMALGGLISAAAALLALLAPSAGWFFVVFAMTGVAAVALVITPLALILDYSPVADRPAYIGLSNTLVTPAAILAPLVGGWLADTIGYSATFMGAMTGGLATAVVLVTRLSDPAPASPQPIPVPGDPS